MKCRTGGHKNIVTRDWEESCRKPGPLDTVASKLGCKLGQQTSVFETVSKLRSTSSTLNNRESPGLYLHWNCKYQCLWNISQRLPCHRQSGKLSDRSSVFMSTVLHTSIVFECSGEGIFIPKSIYWKPIVGGQTIDNRTANSNAEGTFRYWR